MYETRPYESFNVVSEQVTLGPLRPIFTRISGQYFERTDAMARADGVDDLVLSVRFKGGANGDMNGIAVDAGDGAMLLTDMAQPQAHWSAPSISAYMHVPRALAEEFLPRVRSLHGLLIDAAAAALVREHFLQIWRSADRLPADKGGRLAATVMDLLAISVAQMRGGEVAPETAATGLLAQARAEIEARLGSATLNAASLCRTLGLSRSTLYRLFDAEGGVQAYIARRRLERVAAALRETEIRISDIAERWGFCDAAYLGRVFRERFGMTPGEFRAFSRGRPA